MLLAFYIINVYFGGWRPFYVFRFYLIFYVFNFLTDTFRRDKAKGLPLIGTSLSHSTVTTHIINFLLTSLVISSLLSVMHLISVQISLCKFSCSFREKIYQQQIVFAWCLHHVTTEHIILEKERCSKKHLRPCLFTDKNFFFTFAPSSVGQIYPHIMQGRSSEGTTHLAFVLAVVLYLWIKDEELPFLWFNNNCRYYLEPWSVKRAYKYRTLLLHVRTLPEIILWCQNGRIENSFIFLLVMLHNIWKLQTTPKYGLMWAKYGNTAQWERN